MVKVPAVREYVLRLPGINCTLDTFISCFLPFLQYYQAESKRYYFSNFPTQEAIDECTKWLLQLEPLVNGITIPVNPSYLMGSTISVKSEKILYAIDRKDGTLLQVSLSQDLALYESV